jgi:hypothetical protein
VRKRPEIREPADAAEATGLLPRRCLARGSPDTKIYLQSVQPVNE